MLYNTVLYHTWLYCRVTIHDLFCWAIRPANSWASSPKPRPYEEAFTPPAPEACGRWFFYRLPSIDRGASTACHETTNQKQASRMLHHLLFEREWLLAQRPKGATYYRIIQGLISLISKTFIYDLV